MLFAQLSKLSPLTKNRFGALTARFKDLVHAYAGTPIEFSFDGKNFYVLKSLSHDKSIILTKPDKGVGLMVIDYNVYRKCGIFYTINLKFQKVLFEKMKGQCST